MTGINPAWLARLDERQRKFALTAYGQKFLYQFLWKRGEHLFILGTTGSGKTQKAYWLCNWLRNTKETVIWLDSCKNREFVPLVTMGTPVRIICPKGCDVELTEWSDDDRAYVRMKNHPDVVTVPDPGSAWWAAKRGYINIFSFRNSFETDEARLIWMAELFKTLAVWLRRGIFPRITPFCLIGDEFQWVNAGAGVTSDADRAKVSEGISENAFEIRGYGGRIVILTQLYKSIPPATRKNLPCLLLNRDAIVDSSENPPFSRFNPFVPYFKPNEGLFVYSDKKPHPANAPWKFPYFSMPKIRVSYKGSFDRPTPAMKEQDEVERELTPPLDKYGGIAKALEGYEIPREISRYEVMPDSPIE